VKALKNKKGLTLTELIVAIAIFGIVSVMFLLIFSAGMTATIRAGHREAAIVGAGGAFDEFLTDGKIGLDDPDDLPEGVAILVRNDAAGEIVITYGSGAVSTYHKGNSTRYDITVDKVVNGEDVKLQGFILNQKD